MLIFACDKQRKATQDSMKRLLIFHPAPAPYRVDFFNEIGCRFCLHIVFLRREAEEVLVAQQKLLEGATFTYEYIPYHFRVLGRDIGFGYTKILRKFRPDVVIATEFSMSLLVPLLLRSFAGFKYKVLTQCDDSIFMAEARTGGRRRRANWMLRRADGMITISREVSEWYLRNTSVKRAIEFPIIHDETAFSEHRSEIQQMAASHIRRFSLAGHRVGLFVGRFVEVKNLPLLLQVLAQVNPRLPSDWRFVLVGDGDEAPLLHQQVATSELSDHVLFVGRHEGLSLWAWYAVASFIVLPSRQEAFGAVVGEALQMGCRALVSKYAGGRSLIRERETPDDEEKDLRGLGNGKVFSPDETDEFQRTILEEYLFSEPTPAEGFGRSSIMPFGFDGAMCRLEAEIKEIINR